MKKVIAAKLKKTMTKKRFFLSMAIAMTALGVYAQGDGAAGIVEATDMVTSYFDPAV